VLLKLRALPPVPLSLTSKLEPISTAPPSDLPLLGLF
jgi:hypothetical protein